MSTLTTIEEIKCMVCNHPTDGDGEEIFELLNGVFCNCFYPIYWA